MTDAGAEALQAEAAEDGKPRLRPSAALALVGVAGLAVLLAWAFLSAEGAGAFLDAHFWAPVRAQAALEGEARYSTPSLIGYSATLALALGGLHWILLERMRVPVDRAFFVILAPFMAWGPLARALQDSGYFLTPDLEPSRLGALVVEPLVYVTTAALALATLLWWRLVAAAPSARARTILSLGALGLVTGLEGLLFTQGSFALSVSPGALLAGFAVAAAAWWGARRHDPAFAAALSLGLLLLAPLVALALRWSLAAAPPWAPPSAWAGNHPAAVPLVVSFAAATAALVAGGTRPLAGRFPRIQGAGSLMGGLLVFAHALDAGSTLLALNDPLDWGLPGYGENNPVSAGLLAVAGGAPFVLVKLLLPAGVACVLANEAKREGERTLALFLALVVFALGFGPGARNLARLAMGV